MVSKQEIIAVLENGDLQAYNNQRLTLIRNGDFSALSTLESNIKSDNDLQNLERCRKCLKQRRNRISKRINDMIFKYEANCYFITLTFRNEIFETTSPKTRREYVIDFLNSHCGEYVANIDFGDNHEYVDFKGDIRTATKREHYHAFVNKKINSKDWFEKCGCLYGEKVRKNEHTPQKVSEYITKLTNHAMKVQTLVEKPIFSRVGKQEIKKSLWIPKTLIKPYYEKLDQRLNAKITTNSACPFRTAIQTKNYIDFKRFIESKKN